MVCVCGRSWKMFEMIVWRMPFPPLPLHLFVLDCTSAQIVSHSTQRYTPKQKVTRHLAVLRSPGKHASSAAVHVLRLRSATLSRSSRRQHGRTLGELLDRGVVASCISVPSWRQVSSYQPLKLQQRSVRCLCRALRVQADTHGENVGNAQYPHLVQAADGGLS